MASLRPWWDNTMPVSFANPNCASILRLCFPVSKRTSPMLTWRPRGVSVVGRTRLNCSSSWARRSAAACLARSASALAASSFALKASASIFAFRAAASASALIWPSLAAASSAWRLASSSALRLASAASAAALPSASALALAAAASRSAVIRSSSWVVRRARGRPPRIGRFAGPWRRFAFCPRFLQERSLRYPGSLEPSKKSLAHTCRLRATSRYPQHCALHTSPSAPARHPASSLAGSQLGVLAALHQLVLTDWKEFPLRVFTGPGLQDNHLAGHADGKIRFRSNNYGERLGRRGCAQFPHTVFVDENFSCIAGVPFRCNRPKHERQIFRAELRRCGQRLDCHVDVR